MRRRVKNRPFNVVFMGSVNRFVFSVTVILLVILGVAVVSNRGQTGVVEGKVSIGPFSPVEPSTGPVVPLGTYSSRSIILEPLLGKTIFIPLNETGFFRAEVKAGSYQATISNCVFLGCDSSLPVKVVIKAGETTVLSIDIDTGIR